jgi:hypothetical protein
VREFQAAPAGLIAASYISIARISAHKRDGNAKMTKAKMLSGVMILFATVATPVLAQDAGKRGPANGYNLVSQSSPRGAYNQANEPSYNANRIRDRWSPENSGNVDRDPQITGGEDITRRPAGS